MARRENKPKMDPTAVPAEKPADVTMDIIEELKAEHPATSRQVEPRRAVTESQPRKPRDR